MDSMQGKRVIITGPTSGVGKEIALGLAALGADLILACRNMDKGQQVALEIAQRNNPVKADVMHFDASSQEAIRTFASQFLLTYDRLDVLINNAAINQGRLPKTKNVDGVELTFATNVLAYFLLTRELLELLMQSAPSRIINVASTFARDLDLDDLQFEHRKFEGFSAYSQSKACNRLLTWAFARRLAGSGVTINAMTPSLIPTTGLFRHATPERVKELTRYAGGRTAAHGADTAIWLASASDLDGTSNRFFLDRRELDCEYRDEANEEKLWQICEAYTNK